MALGRLDDANVAIFKAISKNTTVIERKECLKIQQEIEAELNNLSGSELEPPQNPLYNIKVLDSDRTNQVGTISAISDQDGIMDIVYSSYLTPEDVVKLERTCKRFVNVERSRRIAIGSRLLYHPSSNDTLANDTLENAITEFVNNTHDSSTVALQKLLSEVKPIVRPKILKPIGVFTYLYMDPISFETFLVSMFSNPSSEEAHILCEGIEWYYLSIWDFKIVRFLLKEEHTFVKHRILILNKILSRLNDEVIPFTGRFFKYSLDIEVMKLAILVGNVFTRHVFEGALEDTSSDLSATCRRHVSN